MVENFLHDFLRSQFTSLLPNQDKIQRIVEKTEKLETIPNPKMFKSLVDKFVAVLWQVKLSNPILCVGCPSTGIPFNPDKHATIDSGSVNIVDKIVLPFLRCNDKIEVKSIVFEMPE